LEQQDNAAMQQSIVAEEKTQASLHQSMAAERNEVRESTGIVSPTSLQIKSQEISQSSMQQREYLSKAQENSQSEIMSTEQRNSLSEEQREINSDRLESGSLREYRSQARALTNGSESRELTESNTEAMEGRRSNVKDSARSGLLTSSSAREMQEQRTRNISEGETLAYNSQIVAANAEQRETVEMSEYEFYNCREEREMCKEQIYECRNEREQSKEHCQNSREDRGLCREETSTLKERTLSWEHQDARLTRDQNDGQDDIAHTDEGDGICWHHINYKSVEDVRNQPEFLRAKLRKTSFGPGDRDRRRKSSGSDTSSR